MAEYTEKEHEDCDPDDGEEDDALLSE